MKHLSQPTRFTCGQTCVAMVADIPVKQAIAVVCQGDRGTHATHLIPALKKLGVKCSDKTQRIKKGQCLPGFAILRIQAKVRIPKWYGHWVVVKDWLIYDPDKPIVYSCPYYFNEHSNLKITSYIEILN